jgi:hypothetical protein
MLNTNYATPYFQAQLPEGYPLSLVCQKCRAFRRLPPNIRALAAKASVWADKNFPYRPTVDGQIAQWYDSNNNELDPVTGRPLTDAEIDAEWGSDPSLDTFTVTDIPIPPGGFPDPNTWQPEEEEVGPLEFYRPSLATVINDLHTQGAVRTADEYGVLQSIKPQEDGDINETKEEFAQRVHRALSSPYFHDNPQERSWLTQTLFPALLSGDEINYNDLGGWVKELFDRAELVGKYAGMVSNANPEQARDEQG